MLISIVLDRSIRRTFSELRMTNEFCPNRSLKLREQLHYTTSLNFPRFGVAADSTESERSLAQICRIVRTFALISERNCPLSPGPFQNIFGMKPKEWQISTMTWMITIVQLDRGADVIVSLQAHTKNCPNSVSLFHRFLPLAAAVSAMYATTLIELDWIVC